MISPNTAHLLKGKWGLNVGVMEWWSIGVVEVQTLNTLAQPLMRSVLLFANCINSNILLEHIEK